MIYMKLTLIDDKSNWCLNNLLLTVFEIVTNDDI
jgi:hypothetical protein